MAADVGEMAPDFALYGAGGKLVRSEDLRGSRRAMLVFYPKDMTTG